MPTFGLARPNRAAGYVLVVALAFGCATVLAIRATLPWDTTYAAVSRPALAADIVAGFALVVAGLLLAVSGFPTRLAMLVISSGAAWFAHDWIGWYSAFLVSPAASYWEARSVARIVAMVAAPLFIPLIVHVVLAAPSGYVDFPPTRWLVGIGYTATLALTLARAVVTHPVYDPYCWNDCTTNSVVVMSHPALAHGLAEAAAGVALALAVTLFVAVLRRLWSSASVARRLLWPVLAPGALLAAALAAHALALLATPRESPQVPLFLAIFLVTAWSTFAVGAGFVWMTLRARRIRTALAKLASDLGAAPPPGSLKEALRSLTGDPTVEVAYWLGESQRYVDAAGSTIGAPSSRDGRGVTPLLHEGALVAVVTHDRVVVDATRLERAIGSAAWLAIENERLQAEVLAHLQDLRESRARIVESGDAERRRLERNLHDGAQQRMLALSYEVRRALAAAETPGDHGIGALLTRATEEVQAAVDNLRDVAHGIYPAVLTEAGLGPALWTLADSAPIPVEIHATDERFAPVVERTAYVVAASCIEDAAENGAKNFSVCVNRRDQNLVVEVHAAGRLASRNVADRVAALGGRLELDGSVLRVELPCE